MGPCPHRETMPNQHLIVLCTVPDRESANSLAQAVVEDGLAACVNIVPHITSVYRWQGQLQSDDELLLIIKTSAKAYGDLEGRITDLHPYELPEIIAVPIHVGLPGYLTWIDESLTGVK
jgi:periplasmic divalent cation tolerance protein